MNEVTTYGEAPFFGESNVRAVWGLRALSSVVWVPGSAVQGAGIWGLGFQNSRFKGCGVQGSRGLGFR